MFRLSNQRTNTLDMSSYPMYVFYWFYLPSHPPACINAQGCVIFNHFIFENYHRWSEFSVSSCISCLQFVAILWFFVVLKRLWILSVNWFLETIVEVVIQRRFRKRRSNSGIWQIDCFFFLDSWIIIYTPPSHRCSLFTGWCTLARDRIHIFQKVLFVGGKNGARTYYRLAFS